MSPTFSFLCAETAAVATNDFGIDWSVLAIVLAGILAVMLVIRGVGLLVARSIPEPGVKKPIAKKAPSGSASVSKQDDGITDELIVVLTAAASAALGSNVRILEVTAGKMAAQRNWSQEGRREIYLSHRIR
jgi:Na+-transporting methylmalonyl-CoA/oxaloacetate decarboxylase gamma subunit